LQYGGYGGYGGQNRSFKMGLDETYEKHFGIFWSPNRLNLKFGDQNRWFDLTLGIDRRHRMAMQRPSGDVVLQRSRTVPWWGLTWLNHGLTMA